MVKVGVGDEDVVAFLGRRSDGRRLERAHTYCNVLELHENGQVVRSLEPCIEEDGQTGDAQPKRRRAEPGRRSRP
jgi:hypothetical protein